MDKTEKHVKTLDDFLEEKVKHHMDFANSKKPSKKKSFWAGLFGTQKSKMGQPTKKVTSVATPIKGISPQPKDTRQELFNYALDLFFKFADSKKEKIVQILIYPRRDEFDYFCIEFMFLLDGEVSWYLNSETKDLFSLFEQKSYDGFAEVSYNLSTTCKSYEETGRLIFNYIEDYEKANPNRTFVKEPSCVSKKIWSH